MSVESSNSAHFMLPNDRESLYSVNSLRDNLITDLAVYRHKLQKLHPVPVVLRGFVNEISGLVVKARLPNARIGEVCNIEPMGQNPVAAEIVGFSDEDVFLTPYDSLYAVGPHTSVVNKGAPLHVPVGWGLLGRVVDSLGNPVDGKGELEYSLTYPVRRSPPPSLERSRISSLLPLGVKAVDALLAVGEGQRVGVFSVAGVGKSSLLGMIARNSKVDVTVVGLVGERGREVLDFLEDSLGEKGLERSVVVVSTSDEAPMRRVIAAYSATAIAEFFRDQGMRVMLLMDSITRVARGLREIALSIGEPPIRAGYPPSVFSVLPQLLERVGKTKKGSITAFYTILLSSEQVEDPLGEEVRAILDGHLYLSSRLSQIQHYPAIDVLASNSRLMDAVASPEHRWIAERMRKLWAIYEENRDLISIGAYKKGSDEAIDEAIAKRREISNFLVQPANANFSFEDTLALAKKALA